MQNSYNTKPARPSALPPRRPALQRCLATTDTLSRRHVMFRVVTHRHSVYIDVDLYPAIRGITTEPTI